MVVYGHGVQQPIEIAPPLLAAWGSLEKRSAGTGSRGSRGSIERWAKHIQMAGAEGVFSSAT